MTDLFNGIKDLFVNVLLKPFDGLAALELENWWAANSFSWIFILIGMAAFVYWMGQLKKYNDNNEERKDVTAHPYL